MAYVSTRSTDRAQEEILKGSLDDLFLEAAKSVRGLAYVRGSWVKKGRIFQVKMAGTDGSVTVSFTDYDLREKNTRWQDYVHEAVLKRYVAFRLSGPRVDVLKSSCDDANPVHDDWMLLRSPRLDANAAVAELRAAISLVSEDAYRRALEDCETPELSRKRDAARAKAAEERRQQELPVCRQNLKRTVLQLLNLREDPDEVMRMVRETVAEAVLAS